MEAPVQLHQLAAVRHARPTSPMRRPFPRWGAPSSTGAADIAAPGDYDGDGQTDIAVYRESTGTWFLRHSFGGTATIDFGAPGYLGLGDHPVPGDYDGDGLYDLAIYRSTTGVWHVRKSSDGTHASYLWGAPGDYPARR